MGENYLNLPNFLTILRFLFSPVFFILFMYGKETAALATFVFVATTDLADGWIARATKQKTELGKFLDPMADKFMIFLAIAALILKYGFPLWAVPLVLSRDIVSLCGSVLVYSKKRGTWAANNLGKATTFLQIVTVGAYVVDFGKTAILWVTIIVSLATAMSYIARGIKIATGNAAK